ncbi:MAG: DNA translocase FtsK 4TM domain-containing protein, partial [Planctomycetota bacterium]
MSRSTRSARRSTASETLPPPSITARVAWIAAVGVWIFVVISMISFDPADSPSHVVAVHNSPAANLCGAAGAVIAYWAYNVIGVGTWVILAAIAIWLGIIVTGRSVGHPVVRLVGVLLVAVCVSSLHGLIAPTSGPLAGAHAGLIATLIVGELAARFSTVGTFLFLMAGLAIGATVAADRVVLMLPALIMSCIARIRDFEVPSLSTIRPATAKSTKAAAKAKAKAKTKADKKKKVDPKAPIDLDAGGVGGTESFDPDELDEDVEWVEVGEDDEEDPEYEYEYEYVDEDEEYEDEDDDDAEVEADAEDDEEIPVEPAALTEEELRAKIAKLPLRMGNRAVKVATDEDIPREDNFEGYSFPTIELLADPESNIGDEIEKLVREQARKLEESLQIYGIDGEVASIESGPTVTLYSVQLAPGTKVAKVQSIATDIARSLSATNIRIVPTMAGKTTVGIEVPNLKKEKVRLKELMSGEEAREMILPMFLGKDAAGEPLIVDLTKMPHMLIAGTTGSGKSVCMNSIIMSFLYARRPDELKLVLVDPKMVEMALFKDIPHLMCPVVTEMHRASAILEWAVTKMEERYELLAEAGVRDINSYNKLSWKELAERFDPSTPEEEAKIPRKIPRMVFVVDELADLMMTNKEVESFIVR